MPDHDCLEMTLKLVHHGLLDEPDNLNKNKFDSSFQDTVEMFLPFSVTKWSNETEQKKEEQAVFYDCQSNWLAKFKS